MLLTTVDNTDTRTLLASTTSTTRTVSVVLDIIRQSVVDDMCQIINIQATGCHISSNQQLYGMLTELLHRQVTLLLTEVTMQRLSIIAVLDEFICHFLCFHLRTTEDDGKNAWIIVNQSFQCQIFIFGIYHIINMIYMLGTFVT